MAKAKKNVKVDPNKQAVEELKKCIDNGHKWGEGYTIQYSGQILLECAICGYSVTKRLPKKLVIKNKKLLDEIVKYVTKNW